MGEAGVMDKPQWSMADERASGARARVALSALTMAEHFRDEMNQDVLLFVDNIFRFTRAGSEVSALLGRIPSAVGYQLFGTDMGALRERITSTKMVHYLHSSGLCARTIIPTRHQPPRLSLDATTELSRPISELGIYPAESADIDIDDSCSEIVGEALQRGSWRSGILQKYKELQDIIAILGMDELSKKTIDC